MRFVQSPPPSAKEREPMTAPKKPDAKMSTKPGTELPPLALHYKRPYAKFVCEANGYILSEAQSQEVIRRCNACEAWKRLAEARGTLIELEKSTQWTHERGGQLQKVIAQHEQALIALGELPCR